MIALGEVDVIDSIYECAELDVELLDPAPVVVLEPKPVRKFNLLKFTEDRRLVVRYPAVGPLHDGSTIAEVRKVRSVEGLVVGMHPASIALND